LFSKPQVQKKNRKEEGKTVPSKKQTLVLNWPTILILLFNKPQKQQTCLCELSN
jgi:hypothetical protein